VDRLRKIFWEMMMDEPVARRKQYAAKKLRKDRGARGRMRAGGAVTFLLIFSRYPPFARGRGQRQHPKC